MGQEFRKSEVLTRDLSRGCRPDAGWSWRRAGEQPRTGGSAGHYAFRPELRDGAVGRGRAAAVRPRSGNGSRPREVDPLA